MNTMLQALANHRGFVVYRLAPITGKPGKTDKIPIDGLTGYNSNAQNTATWLLPDVAVAMAAEWAPIYTSGTGVGIVIYAGSQLFCIDLDGCINEDGVLSDKAQEIIARFPGCVVEVSASKKGLHIFGMYTGILPPHKSKNTHWHIELYTEARFIALTGNMLHEGNIFTDATVALTAFATEYFPDTGSGYAGEWTDGPADGWDFIRDDEELLKWARGFRDARSAFGGKAPIWALMDAHESIGQWFVPNTHGQLYDASSADQALANFFAWATGNDCERVARLMGRTALKRDKWNREDYFNGTVAKACAGVKPWPTKRALTMSTPVVSASVPTSPLVEARPQPAAAQQHAPTPEAPAAVVPLAPGFVPTPAVVPPVPDTVAAPPAFGPGAVFFTHDQRAAFAGYVYVSDIHMIQGPNGNTYDKARFDLLPDFAGRMFQMQADGTNPTKSAWEAFTESQVAEFPKVRGQYFEPRAKVGEIMTREGQTYVNSYIPLDIKMAAGDVSRFTNHIAKLLPNGRDAHILLQYLKFMVQHKGVKAAWCPFIQGIEGNGKSFISMVMTYALGKRYTHVPKASELDGRFNSVFYGKLFISVNDVKISEDRGSMWETLKPMIDGKELEIEAKGVDKVTREVCFNFILNSNHKDGIRKTKNDRRIAPFFCAQQNDGDLERDGLTKEYFTGPNGLWAWSETVGLQHVAHWLANDPIDQEFNPATLCVRAPETTSTNAAIEAGQGSIEQDVLEATAMNTPGFAHGWISGTAVDQMLAGGKGKFLSRSKRREMLATIGYMPHPALPDGRPNTPLTDGTRPRLYINKGHPLASLTDPKLIKEAYEMAQKPK